MTLRFVKTSILSSSDGIDFSNEQQLEGEEARKKRLAQESAAVKPLYEQLAELKEQQQLEYDENTKLIFAPPKALDEDDIEYLREMEDSHAQRKARIHEKDKAELAAFREAQKADIPLAPVAKIFSSVPKAANPAAKPAPIIRVKRKQTAADSGGHSSNKIMKKEIETASTERSDGDNQVSGSSSSRSSSDTGKKEGPEAPKEEGHLLSMFSAYDSD